MKKILVFFLFFMAFFSGFAQPGTLDNTFGTAGIVITSLGLNDGEACAMAIQPDGKIILVGHSWLSYDEVIAVVRYMPDGSLDNSFGSFGIVTVTMGTRGDFGKAVALQPDGKIVVSGYFENEYDYDLCLIRLNSNGTLDQSFGYYGRVITDIDSVDNTCEDMAIQPDGKILVAGCTNDDIVLVRYNSNGVPDSAFGTYGVASATWGSYKNYADGIVIQPDGKIVVSGYVFDGVKKHMAVVRFNSDGYEDYSFGTIGFFYLPLATDDTYFTDVAIQEDGKLVMCGDKWVTSPLYRCDFAAMRLNTNGTIDSTFGDAGMTITRLVDRANRAYGIVVGPEGKIIIAGYTNYPAYNFGMIRMNSDGKLDSTFGTNGIVITQIFGYDYGKDVCLQPDGKIVVAGYVTQDGKSDFAVVRYIGDIVGLNETQVNTSLIYPNPVSDYLNIELGMDDIKINVEVFDILGKTVFATQIENRATLDVSNLANGIYLIKLYSDKYTEVRKFIKE